MIDTNRFRIIQAADELFNAKGYRNVTISELADKLGMSKKTIYQYFSGKEEIAAQVVQITLENISEKVMLSEGKNENPLQVLRETFEQIKDEVIKFNPLFLEDIQKYIPALWKKIEEFRKEKIQFVERLLEKAQNEGLIKNINPRLTMIIFLETVQTLAKPDVCLRYGYSIIELFDTLVNIFYTGIIESKEN